MNVLRALGRTLLGGFFVANGIKAIKDPSPFVSAAQPLADKFVPLAQKTLPPEAAAKVPDDTATLIRLNGGLSVLGGLSLITGIGARSGAALAALSMVPHVLASGPGSVSGDDKDARRSVLVRNLALLGATLVVTQDTKGQPSLTWLANDRRVRLAHDAERAKKAIAREAGHATKSVGKDVRHLQREAKLQAKVARKSIEGALT